jgi:hypothetical protein
MALVKQGALPSKLKGAGGPATGYGSDVNAPPLVKGLKVSKDGGMKAAPIKANKMPAFCGGGSVQGGFKNAAMKGRK